MITIQEVIDLLMEPVDRLESTVDTLKFGESDKEVTGIVSTFIATHNVLKQAVALGANLIITHEGTFYSHLDKTELIKKDPVYLEKRKFIEESGIAIFRFHDYWHRYQPDGIVVGLVKELSWESYLVKHKPVASIFSLPAMNVKEVAEYMKRKLDIPFVRAVGDLSLTCERVGILAGYRGGGDLCIPLFENEQLDLIIAGEGPEWETPEYVRDAMYQKRSKAFLLIGHAASEEAGMKYLAEKIRTLLPTVPVHFVSDPQPFHVI